MTCEWTQREIFVTSVRGRSRSIHSTRYVNCRRPSSVSDMANGHVFSHNFYDRLPKS